MNETVGQRRRDPFLLNGCKCGGVRTKRTGKGCNNIWPNTPVDTPDLAVYSQIEELQKGNIPSWDSPDMMTDDWRPFRLRQDALIKIRNLSDSVPAINALVHYYTSSFGIGTQRELKLSRLVSVPPEGCLGWGRVLYSYIGATAGQMRLGCTTSRRTITAS